METMLLLKKHMSLSEEVLISHKDDFEMIGQFIAKNEISFGSHYALGFYSHMFSYLKRLRDKESVDSIDVSIRNDIENDVYSMTFELIEDLAQKYNQATDESEVLLAAIHIQTAAAMERGELDG